jgi:hypothetical protein
MPRGKVNHNKERHTIWVSPIAWMRMDNMALKAANGNVHKKNVSEMLENAAMAYKSTEQEAFAEMKRLAAIKITAAQEEFKIIEQAEAAYIQKKKNEVKEELKTAFDGKAKIEG